MDLRDYLSMLRRQWVLITAVTLAGLVGAAGFTLLQTPQYQATTQLFVSSGGGTDDSAGQAYQGGLFVQQRVRSYVQVVDSPDVLLPVIDQLGLDTTPPDLAGQVSANAPLDTVLINVTATSENPGEAAALANATAAEFAAYIEELESRQGQSTVPVKVTLVEPAEVPRQPVSPDVLVNLALGLLAGLGLGVGAAVLRESLDTTVRSTTEAEAIVQAPTLGTVGFDSDTPNHPLLDRESASPRAEAFRALRTNLQYVDVDNPVRAVVVTSSLAGEGKTTTSANLALTQAQSGQRVLLLEGDLRRPKAVDLFGLVEGVGLTNVLVGKADFDEVVQSVVVGGLDVLASGPVPPNPSELLGSHQMEHLLTELKERYDLIVIDAPPLLPVTDAAVLARVADGAVMVVRHSKTRREELETAREALESVNARVLGIVVNMIPASGRGYGYSYGYGYEARTDVPKLDEDKAVNRITAT